MVLKNLTPTEIVSETENKRTYGELERQSVFTFQALYSTWLIRLYWLSRLSRQCNEGAFQLIQEKEIKGTRPCHNLIHLRARATETRKKINLTRSTYYFWKKKFKNCSPHHNASFGTFCVQIGQLFEVQAIFEDLKNRQIAIFEGNCYRFRIFTDHLE